MEVSSITVTQVEVHLRMKRLHEMPCTIHPDKCIDISLSTSITRSIIYSESFIWAVHQCHWFNNLFAMGWHSLFNSQLGTCPIFWNNSQTFFKKIMNVSSYFQVKESNAKQVISLIFFLKPDCSIFQERFYHISYILFISSIEKAQCNATGTYWHERENNILFREFWIVYTFFFWP